MLVVAEGVVFIVVEVMVAGVAVLTGVALIVSVVVAVVAVVVVDFLRRFFSMPRGRKRLAVLATGFR